WPGGGAEPAGVQAGAQRGSREATGRPWRAAHPARNAEGSGAGPAWPVGGANRAEVQDGPQRGIRETTGRPWMAAHLARNAEGSGADPACPVGGANRAEVQDGPQRGIDMSKTQQVTWTALPNGINTGVSPNRLMLSVFIAPRLQVVNEATGGQTLAG